MSDPRPPPTSSPGRLQPIARPDWPWAARTYSQRRSTQSSPHPSVLGSNLQTGWDPRASVASNSSQSMYTNHGRNDSTPKPQGSTMRSSSRTSTRQWSFMVQSSFNFWSLSIHESHCIFSGIWMGHSWCSQTERFRWGRGTFNTSRWQSGSSWAWQFRNTQTITYAWRQQIQARNWSVPLD